MSDVEGKKIEKHKCNTEKDQMEGFQNKTYYFICILVLFYFVHEKIQRANEKSYMQSLLISDTVLGQFTRALRIEQLYTCQLEEKFCNKVVIEKAFSHVDHKVFKTININIAGKFTVHLDKIVHMIGFLCSQNFKRF